jgi:hypothetical protein
MSVARRRDPGAGESTHRPAVWTRRHKMPQRPQQPLMRQPANTVSGPARRPPGCALGFLVSSCAALRQLGLGSRGMPVKPELTGRSFGIARSIARASRRSSPRGLPPPRPRLILGIPRLAGRRPPDPAHWGLGAAAPRHCARAQDVCAKSSVQFVIFTCVVQNQACKTPRGHDFSLLRPPVALSEVPWCPRGAFGSAGASSEGLHKTSPENCAMDFAVTTARPKTLTSLRNCQSTSVSKPSLNPPTLGMWGLP